MCTIFKVFIEFVTILLLFYVLVFWPRGMWDLSSLTRDWTRTPCIGRQILNHWTTREVRKFLIWKFTFWFFFFWWWGDAACQYGTILFQRKLNGNNIMSISQWLLWWNINTIKGNTGSLSSFSEKLHLVIVNRWVMILDLSPSELSTPVWADSLPPSPPPVRCCWPLSTSLLLCPFTPGTVTEYQIGKSVV